MKFASSHVISPFLHSFTCDRLFAHVNKKCRMLTLHLTCELCVAVCSYVIGLEFTHVGGKEIE